MSVEDWPLLRWRMREYVHGRWGTEIVKKNARLAEDIVAAVGELGPSTAGQIEAHLAGERARRKGPWWDRSDTKWVAEALWSSGVLTTAHRMGFARHYDLTERVLPPHVLAREVDDAEALRELTLRAATALGVGTEADIRDYFRLRPAEVRPALAALVDAGELEPVEVAGWAAPAYLRAGQIVPRAERGTALLCPFDPLIFFRPRVERLWGFEYRIEIYTPAAKRKYGYYVWPFLLDGRLVGRVDLKADRAAGVLNVVGAFAEPGAEPARTAPALAGELRTMASWLGLGSVNVADHGDLAASLRAYISRRGLNETRRRYVPTGEPLQPMESRMSLYSHVFARVYDPFLALGERSGMRELRRETLAAARGRVLEVGAGTGLNVQLYPGTVTGITLAEPDSPMAARLRRRVSQSAHPVEVVQAPAEQLPFADGSFDTVVSTLVLCTVADMAASLREIARVLAPGGQLLFVEHVRAGHDRLLRWQERLHEPWRRFACGCHCNRDTAVALRDNGFDIEQVQEHRWRRMPRIVQPLLAGAASPLPA